MAAQCFAPERAIRTSPPSARDPTEAIPRRYPLPSCCEGIPVVVIALPISQFSQYTERTRARSAPTLAPLTIPANVSRHKLCQDNELLPPPLILATGTIIGRFAYPFRWAGAHGRHEHILPGRNARADRQLGTPLNPRGDCDDRVSFPP